MNFNVILFCMLAITTFSSHAISIDAIRKSGELRVGVPGDYAPLAFKNNKGMLEGYDIDMANDFGKQLGFKVKFVLTSWPTLSNDLAADKFDIAIGGITATYQRSKDFSLSNPVVPNGKIALATCDSASKLTNLEKIDQPNVRIVVNPGGTNQSYVDENIKHAQVTMVKNNIDNLQALRNKTADMMVTDLIEGDYYNFKEPGVLCVVMKKPFLGTESYKVYMMSKENHELLWLINQWLLGPAKHTLAKKWNIR
jgi:cyclohexadienyl dehydratase